jgi:hypothetical protein
MVMRIRSAARAARAMAVVLPAVFLAAGCAAPAPGAPARAAAWMPVTGISGTGLTLTDADGGLYARWDAAPSGTAVPRMALARLDPRAGVAAASNTFSPGLIGAPLFADGALWVTDSGPLGEFLLRLDPGTLMVTGELKVAGGAYRGGARLAYAGGSVWLAGGDELLRVSPASVQPTAVIALRGAAWSDVAASPDGSALAVLAAGEPGRPARVERRDPGTGALLAARPVSGAVRIDGFAGSGVWITRTAGSSAWAERYSAGMVPAGTVPLAGAASARVAGGTLWVTGGPGRDYCADASSGRRLAAVPAAGPRRGELPAVGPRALYYAEPAGPGAGTGTGTGTGTRWRMAAVPVPAACG